MVFFYDFPYAFHLLVLGFQTFFCLVLRFLILIIFCTMSMLASFHRATRANATVEHSSRKPRISPLFLWWMFSGMQTRTRPSYHLFSTTTTIRTWRLGTWLRRETLLPIFVVCTQPLMTIGKPMWSSMFWTQVSDLRQAFQRSSTHTNNGFWATNLFERKAMGSAA